MTQRTENPPPSPIERATATIEAELNRTIHTAAGAFNVPEHELRRILALYFERKSLKEWADQLGANVDTVSGPKNAIGT